MPPARAATHFRIHGMDCAEEVAVLRREVGPVVVGADHLSFDIMNGRMTVNALDDRVPAEAILGAVRRSGMRAEVWPENAAREQPSDAGRQGRTLLTLASGMFTAAGFVAHATNTVRRGTGWPVGSGGRGPSVASPRSASVPGSNACFIGGIRPPGADRAGL